MTRVYTILAASVVFALVAWPVLHQAAQIVA
jgi:hypothetical protein